MNNKNINILFLGGAKRVSMAERFIKLGDFFGFKINIFSYELSEDVPISFLGQIIIGLRWKDEKIISHLQEIIEIHEINIVLPFVDPATLIAAILKKEGTLAYIPVSSKEKCDTFFDKVLANEWFQKEKFPVPSNEISFPLIAKPRNGSASKGIMVLKNEVDFRDFKNDFNSENYLIQKFIDGKEYSVDCYVSDKQNKVSSIVPRIRLEVADGEVIKTLTVKDKDIIELTNQLLLKSSLIGPITVQFIKDNKTNKSYIMEVNPRFGGGAIASIEAGADIPKMILNDFLGIENHFTENWTENLLMLRANREFFRICR